MLEFVCGIAVGAVFAPFWMKIWGLVWPWVQSLFPSKS